MSAAALESGWREAHGSALPADRIIDLVIAGDPAAERLWQDAVEALAMGLLTAISLIDPATIVLGGGLAAAGPDRPAAAQHAGQGPAVPRDRRAASARPPPAAVAS
jgi:predicted NBD/HSP70 family sugar kinase